MRIAYLCQSYPPMISGAAIYTAHLARGISNLGHKTLVLAASPSGYFHTVNTKNLETVYLPSIYNPLRVGQKFILWPRKYIKSQLEKFKPDILHIEDPAICSLLGISLRSNFPTLPFILTAHQIPWFVTEKFPPPLRSTIDSMLWIFGKYIYKYMSCVIVPSKTVSKYVFEKTGLTTKAIPNGVDTKLYYPKSYSTKNQNILFKKYNLNPKLPVVLYVGRIDEDKRVDILVEIFSKVIQKVNAQFLIVGDGTRLSEIKSLVKQKKIDNQTRLTGYVNQVQDLPDFYRLAKTLVIGSLVESQGMVVLEAAASGIPVVAFNKGSMPEMIRNNITGYLIPSDDLELFSEKIIYLLKNKNKCLQIGRNARRFAQYHSLTHSIQQHISLYESLLERPSV